MPVNSLPSHKGMRRVLKDNGKADRILLSLLRGLPGLALLLFSFSIYAQTVPVETDSSALALKELTEMTLDQLTGLTVVSSSGLEQALTDAPSTMIVITEQQIKQRGYEQLE